MAETLCEGGYDAGLENIPLCRTYIGNGKEGYNAGLEHIPLCRTYIGNGKEGYNASHEAYIGNGNDRRNAGLEHIPLRETSLISCFQRTAGACRLFRTHALTGPE